MTRKLNIFCILFTFITFFNHGIYAQCKVKTITNACKPNLKPYQYDSYAITDIKFTDKPQKIEVQFTAFTDQKYKLVFCASGFEEELKVNIYDKSSRVKKRNQLYASDNGIDNLFWSFEPPKAGNYYIEYEVPPSAQPNHKNGCVVLLVGVEFQE